VEYNYFHYFFYSSLSFASLLLIVARYILYVGFTPISHGIRTQVLGRRHKNSLLQVQKIEAIIEDGIFVGNDSNPIHLIQMEVEDTYSSRK
jgi:hypothetical protein